MWLRKRKSYHIVLEHKESHEKCYGIAQLFNIREAVAWARNSVKWKEEECAVIEIKIVESKWEWR